MHRKGIAGIHVGLADEAASNVETAERKARADATLVPSWVVLVEGISVPDVEGAAAPLVTALRGEGAGNIDQAVYRLEFTRLKTPWAAG